jgi:hypothetical protein
MSSDAEFPMHERLEESKREAEAIERFVRWLREETDLVLAIRNWKLNSITGRFERDPIQGPPDDERDQLRPGEAWSADHKLVETPASPSEIIARYLGIGPGEFHAEKRQLLEQLRQKRAEEEV